MIKQKKPKEFECKMECKSNCCQYVVLKTVIPASIHPDIKHANLHGIKVVPVDLDMKHINIILDKAIKNIGFKALAVKPLMTRLLRVMFAEYHYKIPLKCQWLKEDGMCKHYKLRPDCCKFNNGNSDSFGVEGCPY